MSLQARWGSAVSLTAIPSPVDPVPSGSYAITTVGKINNEEELIRSAYENGHIHFMEMSGGRINATELVAALINQRPTITEGLLYAQEQIKAP